MNWSLIPLEILAEIHNYLWGSDWVVFTLVCKQWSHAHQFRDKYIREQFHKEYKSEENITTKYSIPRLEFTVPKDVNDFPNGHMFIVGNQGSGKTTLVKHLIQEIKILNPNTIFEYYSSLENSINQDGIESVLKNENIHYGQNSESLTEKLREITRAPFQVYVDHDTTLYLIVDYINLANIFNSFVFNSIVFNGRHFNTFIIFISQIFKLQPEYLRQIRYFFITSAQDKTTSDLMVNKYVGNPGYVCLGNQLLQENKFKIISIAIHPKQGTKFSWYDIKTDSLFLQNIKRWRKEGIAIENKIKIENNFI